MFLVAAKKMLSGVAAPQASLSAAGGLTLPEYHALLQFLCPDIPLSALHPAWVAASSIYDAGASRVGLRGVQPTRVPSRVSMSSGHLYSLCTNTTPVLIQLPFVSASSPDMAARTRSNGGGGAPSSSSSSGCVALPLHAFWESFIVTATYGKFLQALRARCFEPDGWCSCTLDELTQRSAEVVQELLPAGQPVPPPAVLHDVFRKLGGGVDDMGSLNFQAVVDELCGHKQLSLTVAIQVAAAVAMAPSATSTSSMSSQKTLQ